MKGKPVEVVCAVKTLDTPPVNMSGNGDVAERGVDINPFAVVGSVVVAESLHSAMINAVPPYFEWNGARRRRTSGAGGIGRCRVVKRLVGGICS
jgi:hypothetical protein